jgi:hypothetical protein
MELADDRSLDQEHREPGVLRAQQPRFPVPRGDRVERTCQRPPTEFQVLTRYAGDEVGVGVEEADGGHADVLAVLLDVTRELRSTEAWSHGLPDR